MNSKTRVMILPSPPNSGSIGSVTKSIGIAHELVKHNCEVAFVLGGKISELVHANGFKVYPYPVPVPTGGSVVINGLIDFIEWTGMANEDFAKESIIYELEAIKDFKPDVIFSEARPSASISAQIAGIPTVMIASWPCNPQNPANSRCSEECIETYNRQLRRYGLTEISNVTELFYMRANVKLAPTLPELEPEMQNIEGIKFVGYILDLANEKPLPVWYKDWVDLPQIFIYLSVGALSPALYMDVIINTFKDMPFRVICGCGFHYNIDKLPESPKNIKFERYVPTAAIMDKTVLTIFHGGQDTMLTTLLYGVPSITIPGQHYERDYNSAKLESLGASVKLPVHAFRPNRLKKAISDVLNGDHKLVCEKLSQRLKSYGGTKECVKVILDTAKLK